MKKFIFGIVFYIACIPIIESLVDLILSWIETKKIGNVKKVTIGNKEISDLQAQMEEVYTNAIGFQVPSDSEEYEDEYEDKLKNKIGFI